ncbi:MAG: GAF domain-containing protein [Dehalococcoidia bacterium]
MDRQSNETGELAALLDVARSVASTLELEPLLNIILDQLKRIADYSGAGIAISDGDELRFVESRGATAQLREPEVVGVRFTPSRAAPIWDPLVRHEPFIIDDVRGDSDLARAFRVVVGPYLESPGIRYIRSFLGVPLVHRDKLIGLLTLSGDRPGMYTYRHARLAMAIATHAAAAIENARLYEEARAAQSGFARQIERLMVLGGITQQLLAATDLDTVLTVVVESALRLSETSGAAVALIDDDGDTITLAASAGEPRDYFERYTNSRIDDEFLAGTGTGRSLVQRAAFVVEDYATWGEPETRHIGQAAALSQQIRGFVAAPLLVDGIPIGVLRVHDTAPRAWAGEDVALIQALADQAALAIEHARLLRRGQEAAVLEERARLARDLHDSVTQSVFSIGMLAQAARMQHTRAPERLAPTLDRISALAQEALIEMRSLLFELQPAALTEQGLASAIERLVTAMRLRGDLAITFTAESDIRLHPDTELALFRIAQESLANVIKHARANEVTISITTPGNRLILNVFDNGVGFDPTTPITASPDGIRGGMGLRSMRERAVKAGIALDIRSAPGTGSTVEAIVDLYSQSSLTGERAPSITN